MIADDRLSGSRRVSGFSKIPLLSRRLVKTPQVRVEVYPNVRTRKFVTPASPGSPVYLSIFIYANPVI